MLMVKQCCGDSCGAASPPLEKKQKMIKKTGIQNILKKSKSNLKFNPPVLAHKKLKYYALFASSF